MNYFSYFIFTFFTFLKLNIYAQGEFLNLKNELSCNDTNDTVIVFGQFGGGAKIRYVLATSKRVKFIEYKHIGNGDMYITVLDSTDICTNCDVIIKYVEDNYNSLVLDFYKPDLWRYSIVRNGKRVIVSSSSSHVGEQYFFGLYCRGNLEYDFFEKKKNINIFYQKATRYWVYCNLLRNQWAEFISNYVY